MIDLEVLLESIDHNFTGTMKCRDGSSSHWLKGQPHRTDGYALEYGDGGGEYWIAGRYYTAKEFDAIKEFLK